MFIPPHSFERLMPTFPRQGAASTQWQLSSPKDNKPVLLPFSSRPVIPVVFLPGVMATNLCKTSGKGKVVWEPPNMDSKGLGHLVKTLLKYLFKSSARRQEELNPNDSEVFYKGQVYPKQWTAEPVDNLYARGWGSVMRTAYHPIMEDLQIKLNAAAVQQNDSGSWWKKDALGRFSHPELPAPVTEEEVFALSKYRFDVWGGGYNWLQSNVDSAIDIINWLETELPRYYNLNGMPLLAKTKEGKIPIILVTHSMGGLVARSISELLQPESSLGAVDFAQKQLTTSARTIDVIGINHIAMPAEGAPKLYMHMRSGYPAPSGLILSRNSADFVAVSYRIKSTFELLPFRTYDNGKPWLFISENCKKCQFTACGHNRLSGAPSKSLELPKNGDAVTEIYKATHAFGLIPNHNLHLVYPYIRKEKVTEAQLKDARKEINENIDNAAFFQAILAEHYHHLSYIYWKNEGKSEKSPHTAENDEDYFSSGPVVWKGHAAYPEQPQTMPESTPRNPLRDYGIGLMIHGWEPETNGISDHRPRWSICDGFVPGDGTVDEVSGSAPRKIKLATMVTAHHKNLEPVRIHIAREGQQKVDSYSHQDVCNDQSVQWFSCYAIAKIVAKNVANIPTFFKKN